MTWPVLTLSEWIDTRDTFHLWTQIVGKIRMALEPMVNHWWQVPLYVSARGLTDDDRAAHRPRPRLDPLNENA